jgi:hypothetical protein
MKSRLHLYPHDEPQTTAYIVGEKAALKELGKALLTASQSGLGFDTVKLHTADGHEYSIMVISSVSEEEWQTMSTPYTNKLVTPTLQIIRTYNEVKDEIAKSR